MYYLVKLTDHEDKMPVREKYLEAHKAYLRENSAVVEAGSIHAEGQAKPLGGMWVLKCENRDEAWKVIEADPFHVNGLRKEVEIYDWKVINLSLN